MDAARDGAAGGVWDMEIVPRNEVAAAAERFFERVEGGNRYDTQGGAHVAVRLLFRVDMGMLFPDVLFMLFLF